MPDLRIPRDRDDDYSAAAIIAATVLAGELSLGSAVVAEEWVQARDDLGRNRP